MRLDGMFSIAIRVHYMVALMVHATELAGRRGEYHHSCGWQATVHVRAYVHAWEVRALAMRTI